MMRRWRISREEDDAAAELRETRQMRICVCVCVCVCETPSLSLSLTEVGWARSVG